jgi:hypothetical protein
MQPTNFLQQAEECYQFNVGHAYTDLKWCFAILLA